jgi:outer membrane biosynthesis protein TonB
MREAQAPEAAAVASQLLAFAREPARARPAYLHGREPLPDGATVLRFAQGKHFDPEVREAAIAFIRQVCFWDGATHYQLLCAAPHDAHETLKENYHLLMGLIHPDRRESLVQPWPADCTSRVNRAYAVLGDEQQRRDYDAGLRLLASGEVFTPESAAQTHSFMRRRRRSSAGLRLAKGLIIIAAVAGTLLLLEVWLGGPGNYAAFHGFKRTGRGVEADKEAPRFLGLWREPARAEEPPAAEPPEPEAPRVPSPPDPKPSPQPPADPPVAKAPRIAVPAPQPQDLLRATDPPRALEPKAAAAAVQPPPVTPVAKVIPASTVIPSRDPAVTQAIETVVARLVGAYEAGETEKLIALVDTGAAGFWRTERLRQTYGDFFRATRQRKLHVNNLAWQTDERSARARGEATLVTEYFDTPGTVERKVEVEFDIALAGGAPRITRLSLFPNSP